MVANVNKRQYPNTKYCFAFPEIPPDEVINMTLSMQAYVKENWMWCEHGQCQNHVVQDNIVSYFIEEHKMGIP